MSGTVATFVPAKTTICWPWHIRHLGDTPLPWRGDICRDCRRDVAAPADNTPRLIVCLYCAADSGLINLKDAPLV